MGKIYALYAIVLLLLLGIVGIFFKASISVMMSFFWSGCLIIILLNIEPLWRTFKTIYPELSTNKLSFGNLWRVVKAIYQVNFTQSKSKYKYPNQTESPASTNLESAPEVDAAIEQVIAQIDSQEQAGVTNLKRKNIASCPDQSSGDEIQKRKVNSAASTPNYVKSTPPVGTNNAIAAQNSLSGRPRYAEIGDLLKDLIGQKDSVNKKLFKRGEKIYLCVRCQSAYHEDSWESLGRSCQQCKAATKVREYNLPG
jgi:hypothetical protein